MKTPPRLIARTKVDMPVGARPTFQSVAVLPTGAFHVTGARLTFGDRPIGTHVAGTSLDGHYAQELSNLSFNDLMRSLGAAEAETRSAYLGAIRGLAAALDARDPYTAGHSERVSTLSVMIGRIMNLPATEIEVLRLGARILRQVPFLAPHLFSGTQFDPACVEALLAAMPSSHDIEEPALAQLLGRQLV